MSQVDNSENGNDGVEIDIHNQLIFQTLVQLVSGEANLIWSRYNIMLTANAIIAAVMGALAAREGEPSEFTIGVLFIGAILGIGLCANWWGITTRAWRLHDGWLKEAKKFVWPQLKNPYVVYDKWIEDQPGGTNSIDWIEWHARCVIILFGAAYTAILIFTISRL